MVPFGTRRRREPDVDTRKTTLNLPESLHAEAKSEAARLRITLTQLVIQALERELDRQSPERRSRRK